MPTYEKRAGGKIRARVRVEPFPAQSQTFDRKTDAQIWAEALEADLKRKKRAGLLEEELYTYAELIDDYFKHALPEDKNARNIFLKRANWWRREIGSKTLSEVRTRDIAAKRDKLLKEPVEFVDINGKPIGRIDKETGALKLKSAATVNRYLSTLSAMCRYNIVERGWLRSNPVSGLTKKKERNEIVRFLSEQERAALLAACQSSSNKMLHPIVLFSLCTGARLGEIMKLTLADISVSVR